MDARANEPQGDPATSEGDALVPIGQVIRQEREQRGVGTAELARKAELDEELLASVEAGQTVPHNDLLHAIADALGLQLCVKIELPVMGIELQFDHCPTAQEVAEAARDAVALPPQLDSVMVTVECPQKPAAAPGVAVRRRTWLDRRPACAKGPIRARARARGARPRARRVRPASRSHAPPGGDDEGEGEGEPARGRRRTDDLTARVLA
jgi:transcriptional regulator with XRE-family HTH domain